MINIEEAVKFIKFPQSPGQFILSKDSSFLWYHCYLLYDII